MGNKRSDVIIIGGGVIGLASALYAARAGAEVTLLERGEVGSGASSGNAGFVVPSFFSPLASPGTVAEGLRYLPDPEGPFGIRWRLEWEFWSWLVRFLRYCNRRCYEQAVAVFQELNREGVEAHLELAEEGGAEYEFSRKGLLFVYTDPERLARGRETAAKAAVKGFESRFLSGEEVRAVEPLIGPGVIGGIHYLDDAALNPAAFVAWLARRAGELGVKIVTQTEVYGFVTHGRKVGRALTTKGEFAAEQFVLAGGAWLGQMARWLGVRLPLEGGKGVSLTFPKPEPAPRQPLLLDEVHAAVSPMASALRLTGLMYLAGTDLSLDRRRVRGVHRAAIRYVPSLAGLKPVEVWRGLRPCAPDGLPVIGRLRPWTNVIAAGAHNTKGICLGPITGRYVARLLNGESLGGLEATLSPNRF